MICLCESKLDDADVNNVDLEGYQFIPPLGENWSPLSFAIFKQFGTIFKHKIYIKKFYDFSITFQAPFWAITAGLIIEN